MEATRHTVSSNEISFVGEDYQEFPEEPVVYENIERVPKGEIGAEFASKTSTGRLCRNFDLKKISWR